MRLPAVLPCVLVACSGDAASLDHGQEGSVPKNWVSLEAPCGYSFQAPPDVMMVPAQGIDSCADGWAASGCVYRGDFGGFSSDLSEYEAFEQYEEARQSIDGRAAKIVTAASDDFLVAAVHFSDVDPLDKGLRLTVWANCESPTGQQDAVLLFSTIAFPH